MTRFEDWEIRLRQFLEEKQSLPFAWGSHDCMMFAGGVVAAMTGLDLTAHFRGRYKTQAGAGRVLQTFARGGVPEAAAKLALEHGIPEWSSPLQAQRGDVVLVLTPATADPQPDDPMWPAMAIVSLDGWHAVAPSPAGFIRTELKRATRAWRIG